MNVVEEGGYVYNLGDIIHGEAVGLAGEMYVVPCLRQSSPSPLTSWMRREEKMEMKHNLGVAMETITTAAPARTSSSSSFLQETKHLLEMISTHQMVDVSKVVSEV